MEVCCVPRQINGKLIKNKKCTDQFNQPVGKAPTGQNEVLSADSLKYKPVRGYLFHHFVLAWRKPFV